MLLTDVTGSTDAIAAGRYRDVNYVGAAGIAAVLNASGRRDVPFVFGGDGGTLVVPPEVVGPALSALAALQEHAAERLALGLRVGAVPVADARAAGHDVRVARFQVSENYAQALFTGGGLDWAERQVKDPQTAARYASHAEPSADADPYAGLECRWADIPSAHGETVSLLVAATGPDPSAVYREVLREVEAVYDPGGSPGGHPIALDRLRLSADPRRLSPEVRLRRPDRGRGAGALGGLWRRARLWALSLMGKALIARRAVTSETDWGAYPTLLHEATDYRKFDGVLRMVLAGTPAQRQRLEAFLEARHAAGDLAWGLHVSDRAVMTCLVYHRMGQQVHFVDGAGGGYTAASVPFKRRLKALEAA